MACQGLWQSGWAGCTHLGAQLLHTSAPGRKSNTNRNLSPPIFWRAGGDPCKGAGRVGPQDRGTHGGAGGCMWSPPVLCMLCLGRSPSPGHHPLPLPFLNPMTPYETQPPPLHICFVSQMALTRENTAALNAVSDLTAAQRGLEAGLTTTRKTMFADPVVQRRQVGPCSCASAYTWASAMSGRGGLGPYAGGLVGQRVGLCMGGLTCG